MDLNWSNPRVFLEMVKVMLFLANRGVEVLRLDAVAFMWKRLGTNCQNLAEVHMLLQALRAASRIVAPALIHKAVAIVSPKDLILISDRAATRARKATSPITIRSWCSSGRLLPRARRG